MPKRSTPKPAKRPPAKRGSRREYAERAIIEQIDACTVGSTRIPKAPQRHVYRALTGFRVYDHTRPGKRSDKYTDVVTASLADLAYWTGESVSTVQRAIAGLEHQGVLTRIPASRGQTSQWRLRTAPLRARKGRSPRPTPLGHHDHTSGGDLGHGDLPPEIENLVEGVPSYPDQATLDASERGALNSNSSQLRFEPQNSSGDKDTKVPLSPSEIATDSRESAAANAPTGPRGACGPGRRRGLTGLQIQDQLYNTFRRVLGSCEDFEINGSRFLKFRISNETLSQGFDVTLQLDPSGEGFILFDPQQHPIAEGVRFSLDVFQSAYKKAKQLLESGETDVELTLWSLVALVEDRVFRQKAEIQKPDSFIWTALDDAIGKKLHGELVSSRFVLGAPRKQSTLDGAQKSKSKSKSKSKPISKKPTTPTTPKGQLVEFFSGGKVNEHTGVIEQRRMVTDGDGAWEVRIRWFREDGWLLLDGERVPEDELLGCCDGFEVASLLLALIEAGDQHLDELAAAVAAGTAPTRLRYLEAC